MPVQLTSPSGVASPRGTPCPRSRDGLPDRDDVPENVRRVPAEWVRPTGAAPCYARFLDRQGAPQFGMKDLEGH